MECLRSFNLNIRQVTTATGSNVKTWTVGSQEFWSARISGISRFDIEGFKNIDLYKIKIVGDVYTQIASGIGGVIVEDWAFDLFLEGQMSLVSGKINTSTTNYWNIITGSPESKTFTISKNTNEIIFDDPVKSLKYINFQNLTTQGYGGQTTGTVSLDWNLAFVFYYKYEGE